jgi:predicted alpha-1,6-mannanase (GH76 family)
MINSSNLINDGLDLRTCKNNGGTAWTYNQGVILGGLSDLYSVTQDRVYLAVAEGIADATMNKLVNANGVLTEPCEATKSCNGDQCQFKGIFVRNLAYFFRFNPKPIYKTFIQKNARSILHNSRSLSNQFGLSWSGPIDQADFIRQSSALDALNSAMKVNSVA